MHIMVHAMAAMLALSTALGACDAGQVNQQQQQGGGGQGGQGAPTDGGYGPFAGDTGNGGNGNGGNGGFQPIQGGGGGGGAGGEGVVSGASSAPPEFQALITGYLNDYARQMANGWSQVQSVPDTVAALQVNNEHRWQVSLRGGQTYAFIGACDNECDNVDLILESSSGQQIKADVLDDDYPLVDFTAPADGVYTLRIQLKTCTIAPCYVGARLVRQ